MDENLRWACYDPVLRLEACRFSGTVQPFPNHFHDHYVLGLVQAGARTLQCRDGSKNGSLRSVSAAGLRPLAKTPHPLPTFVAPPESRRLSGGCRLRAGRGLLFEDCTARFAGV